MQKMNFTAGSEQEGESKETPKMFGRKSGRKSKRGKGRKGSRRGHGRY